MSDIQPNQYAKEEILRIPVAGGDHCAVVSGYATFYQDTAPGDGHPIGCTITGGGSNSDPRWFATKVEMIVGPLWRSVTDVSPVVNIAGISFRDSDTTDDTGYQITDCVWDTVSTTEGLIHSKRIRLRVTITMCGGEQSAVTKLSYHLTAIGRSLINPVP